MSIVTEGINNSTEEFLVASSTSKTILHKPTTTESSQVASSSNDDLLNQSSSSKSFPSSTISSSGLTSSKDNGGLRRNKEKSLPGLRKFESNNTPKSQHDLLEESQQLQNSRGKGICRTFTQNGYCRFGRNCRYLHSIPHGTFYEETSKQWSNQADSYEIDDTTYSAADDACSLESKRTEVCKFFSRKGFCRFGDSCRYSHQFQEPEHDYTTPGAETTLKKNLTEWRNSKPETSFNGDNDQNARKPTKLCRLFSRNGTCPYREQCRYLHVKPRKPISNRKKSTPEKRNQKVTVKESCELPLQVEQQDKESGLNSEAREAKIKEDNEDINGNTETNGNFDQELATNDENVCHAESEPEKEENPDNERKPVTLRNKPASEMTSDDFQKLRKTEINNLKRKFRKVISNFLEDGGHVFEVEFKPTDPDWRFDVKSVQLSIMIPETYPQENLQVDCLNPDGVLPEKLVRYFNKSSFTWLQDQHENNERADRIELILRPFLRWLDKSLEDIFISGLKMVKREMEAAAAGIQFVTHEELNAKNKAKEVASPPEPIAEDLQCSSYYAEYEDEDASNFPESLDNQSVLVDQNLVNRSMLETARRGTEVKLRNMQLLDGAGILTCSKLTVTVQCGRCKLRSDVGAMSHRSHRIDCEKCHHQQKLTFRPVVMHPFSSVAGYLDLDNCQVVDVPLLTCEFAVQCLPCGRQSLLTGLQYGQCQTTWCLFCHSKMAVSVESLKLNHLQPNTEAVTADGSHVLKLEKKEKKVKDPAVQEGKPLPENGTCKHYKKSFRWLRFPCCGKAYPCDLCHDEKESDHDMKLATRMICGFCAKEQVYSSDRPCVLCASNMTKKSGTHWEGGKGCRDKIKMSRDDRQKYAGTNKTISRKQQPAPKKEK